MPSVYTGTPPMSTRPTRTLCVLLACLLSTPPALAQPAPSVPPVPAVPFTYSPALTDQLKQIQAAALTSDYAYRQLSYLCNNIGPRLSGSPQAARAVEYVADELKKLGLTVSLEKVMVPHWVRGVETGELIEYRGKVAGTVQKLVLTALGGSVATPAQGLKAPVVVVSSFAELEALGRSAVEGKIVLFNKRFDQQLAANGYGGEAYGEAVVYRTQGPIAAGRLGAVAALVRSVGGASYRLPHTGATRYLPDVPKIPAAALAAEDADLLAGLAGQGPIQMQLTLTPRTLPDAVSYNVVADLKGSEKPDEVVIVSGHLDSWDLATGALDDASGVAVAMQTAQLVRQLKLTPKRTLRVIAWMAEENGLHGARAYVEAHKAEMASHIAAFESDLGAGHPVGVVARVDPKAVPMLAPAASVLAASGAGVIRVAGATAPDISLLGELGVPTFAPLQDSRTYFDYHHTPADTLDKVNPRELAENAAVMAVMAYAVANLPQPLPR